MIQINFRLKFIVQMFSAMVVFLIGAAEDEGAYYRYIYIFVAWLWSTSKGKVCLYQGQLHTFFNDVNRNCAQSFIVTFSAPLIITNQS